MKRRIPSLTPAQRHAIATAPLPVIQSYGGHSWGGSMVTDHNTISRASHGATDDSDERHSHLLDDEVE